MSEKQQLAAKCSGLERENEQLAELVGHLHDSLEEQQDAAQQQEQQQLLLGGGLHILQQPIPEGDEDAADADTDDPMLTHSHSLNALGEEAMMAEAGSPTHLQSSAADGAAVVAGAAGAGALPAAAAGDVTLVPEQLFLANEKQLRVAQWLSHRPSSASSSSSQSWQEWQEQLPLEHMSSSSSSTVTMTL